MAVKVMLLSEATLKENSVLQDNVDMKVVTPTIYHVQNFYILPILGTSLFNEIIDQVRVNNVSALNKTLLDLYITPCMIWYTRAELLIHMTYKMFNKAVGVQNADNMNPASLDELIYIKNEATNNAQEYAQRLTKYLLANEDQYPLFLNQPNVEIDTFLAKMNNYNSGMVLDGDGCCEGQYNFRGVPHSPLMARKPCYWC